MKFKNRVVQIIMCSLIALVVVWIGVFATDYIRCGSLKEPLFVIAGDDIADDGGSGTYYGLGYKVKVEKEITAEYGAQLISVEMWMFNKVISASIQ